MLKNISKLMAKYFLPRYQLSLDSNKYDIKSKSFIYIFKSYGDHEFVTFTYQQIKSNKQILYNINPQDLISISTNEYINVQNKSMLKITEILRDNRYLISNEDGHQIFNGDEICDNVLLLERLNNIDLYKIAYSTGFERGRSLSKNMAQQRKEGGGNVVQLAVVD